MPWFFCMKRNLKGVLIFSNYPHEPRKNLEPGEEGLGFRVELLYKLCETEPQVLNPTSQTLNPRSEETSVEIFDFCRLGPVVFRPNVGASKLRAEFRGTL